MNETPLPVLSAADHAQFQQQGYVRVRQAFPKEKALAIQERMWERMQQSQGIDRHDPASWPAGSAGGLGDNMSPLFNEGIASPRLCGAIDELLGKGTWIVPSGWGGFLISFPVGPLEAWDVASEGWHWDAPLPEHFDNPLKSLMVFVLLSEVLPCGGGTLLASGSHQLIEHFYRRLSPEEQKLKQKILKARFIQSHSWFEELGGESPDQTGRIEKFMNRDSEINGVSLRVIEITGQPGDVFICHPALWHAPSANCRTMPRFMRVKGLGQSAGHETQMSG